jgi:hypothetical protein
MPARLPSMLLMLPPMLRLMQSWLPPRPGPLPFTLTLTLTKFVTSSN